MREERRLDHGYEEIEDMKRNEKREEKKREEKRNDKKRKEKIR